MKKVLGLILAATMLLTMLFAMSGVSVSAEENVNLLDESVAKPAEADGREGSFEFTADGALKIHATGPNGYAVSFPLDKAFPVEALPYLQLDIETDGAFNIAMNVSTTPGKSGWPQTATDWKNQFAESDTGVKLDGGSYHGSLDMLGFYTYNDNEKMPEDGNSTIISVAIALYAPGELTLNWLQLSEKEEFEVASGETDPTDATDDTTTAAKDEPTTAAKDDTTTTVAKDEPASGDSAKTGEDTTLVLLMAAAMIVAAAAVTVCARAKKSSK